LFSNFEVQNTHTYFVGENITQSVLVHNNCEWHHLLPAGNGLAAKFAAVGIDDAMRNSAKFGYFLDEVQHRGAGESIHSQKWNAEWKKWFNQTKNPNAEDVKTQLKTMMKDDAFKDLFATGTPATVDYLKWKNLSSKAKKETFEKAKQEALEKAKQVAGKETKQLGTGLRMVGVGEEVIEQPSTFKKFGRVVKKAGKAVPIIGTGVTIACWGCDVYGKGPVYGTVNSTIDLIPGVGTTKGIIEIFTGDFIPDKAPDK
jgi:hypothetical protein